MGIKKIVKVLLSKESLNQMWKFGVVGGMGGGINLVVLAFLREILHWDNVYAAAATAIVVAGFCNFSFNKLWTFGKHSGKVCPECKKGLDQDHE